MANLSSDAIEKKLLSLFFVAPYHMRLLHMDLDVFLKTAHRNLAEVMKLYVEKYKQPPTQEVLVLFCNELVSSNASLEKYSDALLLMDKLPEAKITEFDFCYDKAQNYLMGRKIFDIAEDLKQQFELRDELDFKSIRQTMVNKLLSVEDSHDIIKRGFVFQNAKDRWGRFKELSAGVRDIDLIPFGIKSLDDCIGGMRKPFITLLYSRTSGGKTRTAINIAYNAAISGYNVVFFSLEMAFDLLAACIDSRIALVNSKKILFGNLNKEDREKYRQALIKQFMDKLNIWIVDIPSGMKSIQIYNELEMYRAATGLIPDLVVVDYANLVEPMRKYQGRSEQYDVLFKEFHEIARSQKVALLTATQESREATKATKQQEKSKEEIEGIENIGLSNYIAPHCEIAIRLRQTSQDRLQNRLWAVIDKDRYGERDIEIPLFALWDRTYVGDRRIPGSAVGVVVKKEYQT